MFSEELKLCAWRLVFSEELKLCAWRLVCPYFRGQESSINTCAYACIIDTYSIETHIVHM